MPEAHRVIGPSIEPADAVLSCRTVGMCPPLLLGTYIGPRSMRINRKSAGQEKIVIEFSNERIAIAESENLHISFVGDRIFEIVKEEILRKSECRNY